MPITIQDLKKHLGPGFGLRKNRYMLEMPAPSVNGETINILCRSTGLPERRITTTDLWHKGRRYTVRGETDYVGEFEVSIVDDSSMGLRKIFDNWLKIIDDSRPDKGATKQGASYESPGPSAPPDAKYQVDINIWQMDRQEGYVYGYKLQNAFPKEVGTVTLDDSDENTLSEFSVIIAFSEFVPISV